MKVLLAIRFKSKVQTQSTSLMYCVPDLLHISFIVHASLARPHCLSIRRATSAACGAYGARFRSPLMTYDEQVVLSRQRSLVTITLS